MSDHDTPDDELDLELDLEIDLDPGLDPDPESVESTDADDAADADVSYTDPALGAVIDEVELEDGQIAYDCATWAGESRGLLASLLSTAGISHAWQGTTVTVREEDEAAVDDLIDDVLASARPALDPSAAKLVYEVGEWPVALQTELADALTAADLPYEWDERGDLVVREEDEDQVAAVLDELPDPDESGISADDGVAVHELFDSLFLAADKLARHPTDAGATVSIVDNAEVIAQVALPFGFEPAQWRGLVGEVAALRAAISGEPASADDGDDPDGAVPGSDEQIAELSRALRDHLRQYV